MIEFCHKLFILVVFCDLLSLNAIVENTKLRLYVHQILLMFKIHCDCTVKVTLSASLYYQVKVKRLLACFFFRKCALISLCFEGK